ncbi:hypothetical protein ANABIO32_16740 [Rossellomorea marisflavi]|nr:hypothetical protein ASG66_15590 [Bacillus sp. Leaf406]GLI83976.1 hypothetical protein ANABIO32_16740 [Rossellomorea marisflavi]
MFSKELVLSKINFVFTPFVKKFHYENDHMTVRRQICKKMTISCKYVPHPDGKTFTKGEE